MAGACLRTSQRRIGLGPLRLVLLVFALGAGFCIVAYTPPLPTSSISLSSRSGRGLDRLGHGWVCRTRRGYARAMVGARQHTFDEQHNAYLPFAQPKHRAKCTCFVLWASIRPAATRRVVFRWRHLSLTRSPLSDVRDNWQDVQWWDYGRALHPNPEHGSFIRSFGVMRRHLGSQTSRPPHPQSY
jgi:hypothetical protein